MIYEIFNAQVELHPSKLAIVCGGARLTYAELAVLVKMKEHNFLAKHVGLIRLIADELSNSVDSVATLLMAAKLGATVMPTAHNADAVLRSLYKYIGRERPYLLLSTSGTTANPKLIALSERTKLLRAQHCAKLYDVTARDYVLASTPLTHSLAQRLVFTGLLHGATVELLPRYAPDLWLNAIGRTTFTMSVPGQLRYLYDARQAPVMRCLVSSSSTLSSKLRDDLRCMPFETHQCYGTSEVAIAASSPIAADDSVGSMLADVDIRLTDAKEITIKSPLMFDGYFEQHALTAQALDEEGYFRTGDVGRFCYGALYLDGRVSDRIKVGAVTVWPSHVENVLKHCTQISELAVFGALDDTLGERVVVAVSSNVTLRELQQHGVTAGLTDSELPRGIVRLGRLPRTSTGKVLRRKLREIYDAALTAVHTYGDIHCD